MLYIVFTMYTIVDVIYAHVSLRSSSVKMGTIRRRLAWPLCKDDVHKSRSVNKLLSLRSRRNLFVTGAVCFGRCFPCLLFVSVTRKLTRASLNVCSMFCLCVCLIDAFASKLERLFEVVSMFSMFVFPRRAQA